jgi:hypothetical protein
MERILALASKFTIIIYCRDRLPPIMFDFWLKFASREAPFSTKKLTPLSCFANLYFVTQLFDSASQALRGALLIGAYEIKCSKVAIRHLIA